MKSVLLRKLLIVPAAAIIISGCDKSPAEPSGPELPSKAPSISKIEPASALPGDEVSITGENFGKWAEYVEVFFGAEPAETVSVSDKKIVVKVPAPAATLASPQVDVEIIVGKFVSEKAVFAYAVPAISKIEPASALPGDEVSITGENLGKWAEKAEVFFGAEKAENVSVSDGKIVVKVPAPAATLASPQVDVKIIVGKIVSGKAAFAYAVPVLDGCSDATGFPGEELILSGSGFAEPKGGCKVFFGGAQAQVVEASADRLIVIAPQSAQESVQIKVLNSDYPVLCSGGLEYRYDAAATALAGAQWTVKTHADGAVCRKATVIIKLLEAEKTLDISVFEAPLRGKYELAIGMSHVEYTAATSAICVNYGALAGLNASFFNMGGIGDCCDYVRIDGIKVVEGRGIAVQDAALNSAMIFNKKGEDVSFRSFYTPDGPAYNTNALAAQLEGDNVLAAGPALMLEGKVMTVPVSPHNSLNTARSAVGMTASGRFMMVAVDRVADVGITNYEHVELMRRLGCREAMSLDGGGSTTLYYKDWGGSGVVNSPSGGFERAVCNVIYVKAK